MRTQLSQCRALATGILAFMEHERGADRFAVRRGGRDSAMAVPTRSSLRTYSDKLAADQPFIGRSHGAFGHGVPRAAHTEEGECPGAHRHLAAAVMVGPETGSGKRREGGGGRCSESGRGGGITMWFRLMMIAFVFNGLCPFGLRVLAGMGLADHYTPLYLVFWYLAGAIAMLALFSRAPVRPARSDMLVCAGLGLFSTCGQTSM